MTSHLNFKILWGGGGSFLDEYFLVCKIVACFEIYQKSYYNLVQFNALWVDNHSSEGFNLFGYNKGTGRSQL